MNTLLKVLIAPAAVLAALGIIVYTAPKAEAQLELGVCRVTESTVYIGHQVVTQLMASSSSRQWAIIQQPQNATNTVSLSFTGQAVSGRGYQLDPNSGTLIHASTTDEIMFGFATPLRTGERVTAITNAGSTTIKVIDCK